MKNEPEFSRTTFSKEAIKGAHFILAAAICWTVIAAVYLGKGNGFWKLWSVFGAMALLTPLAFALGKPLGYKKSDRKNPYQQLGLLLNFAQLLYFPLFIWFIINRPQELFFPLGIITAAHLLPYGWLYQSRTYSITSVVVTLGITVVFFFFRENYSILPVGIALAFWLMFFFLRKELKNQVFN